MKFKLETRLSSFHLTSILWKILRETNVENMVPREGELIRNFWEAARCQEEMAIEEAGDDKAGTWLGLSAFDNGGEEGIVTLGWRGQWTAGRFLTISFTEVEFPRCTYKVAPAQMLDVTIECSLGENENRHPRKSNFFRTVFGEYAEQMETEDSVVKATIQIAKGLRDRPKSHGKAAVEWLEENGYGHLL